MMNPEISACDAVMSLAQGSEFCDQEMTQKWKMKIWKDGAPPPPKKKNIIRT